MKQLFLKRIFCAQWLGQFHHIHLLWSTFPGKLLKLLKMLPLPPIHTLYLRSDGTTIFTRMLAGAKAVISLGKRTSMFGNMVVTPLNCVGVQISTNISFALCFISNIGIFFEPFRVLVFRLCVETLLVGHHLHWILLSPYHCHYQQPMLVPPLRP